MKTATIKWVRQYRKKGTGTLVFVYEVHGTKEQLAAYKESCGDFYLESKESGRPLFFTTRFCANNTPLIPTEEGRWVPDTTQADQLASLTNQYGIDVALRLQGTTTNHSPKGDEEEVEDEPEPKVATPSKKK